MPNPRWTEPHVRRLSASPVSASLVQIAPQVVRFRPVRSDRPDQPSRHHPTRRDVPEYDQTVVAWREEVAETREESLELAAQGSPPTT